MKQKLIKRFPGETNRQRLAGFIEILSKDPATAATGAPAAATGAPAAAARVLGADAEAPPTEDDAETQYNLYKNKYNSTQNELQRLADNDVNEENINNFAKTHL